MRPRPWRSGGLPRGSAARRRVAARGFTYLGVLFLVALTAAGLAALGKAWSTASQRERERELQFRGEAIAAAITSYQKATPKAPPELPRSLDDLLEDRRGVVIRRHLRQRYADPFTGEPDWELVTQDADKTRFGAVRSRSTHPLLREMAPDGAALRKASDWLFVAQPADGSAAATASLPGASAPASAPP
ncbi:type II secretion system protein [Roseateles sp.]|uniref:type II secretion system protein n=1 Tax=Roseateles sp. TaxID=1971397 RepID=UPI003BA9FF1A